MLSFGLLTGACSTAGTAASGTTATSGIHADTDLATKNGTVLISKSYDGIEGTTVTIDGGDSANEANQLFINGGTGGTITGERPHRGR